MMCLFGVCTYMLLLCEGLDCIFVSNLYIVVYVFFYLLFVWGGCVGVASGLSKLSVCR